MRKLVLLALFLYLAAPAYADIIYYGDGSKSVGKIIKESDKIVIIREVDANGVVCNTEAQKTAILKIVHESGEVQKLRVQEIKESKKIKIVKPPKPAAKPAEKKIVPAKVPVQPKTAPVIKEKLKPAKKIARNCSYRLSRTEDKGIVSAKIRMKRKEITIIVAQKVSFEQLRDILACAVEAEMEKSEGLDALWITVMREGIDSGGMPSAYAIWAPPGGWDDFSHTEDKSAYRWEYRKIKKWM